MQEIIRIDFTSLLGRVGIRTCLFTIFYIKESIQAYEITLKSEADSVEAIWCNIVTRNSTLTIGVVYRSPNIGDMGGEQGRMCYNG